MKYISTRRRDAVIEQVLLTGLAPDGRLYTVELPSFSPEQIASWRDFSYVDLAYSHSPFIGDALQPDELKRIITGYSDFGHPEVHRLPRSGRMNICSFPDALAFKDFALRVLRCWIMSDEERSAGGDSGSDFRRYCSSRWRMPPLNRVDIFILHPHPRFKEQRRRMTTMPGENVFNLAVEGNFDDCQRIVKAAFLIIFPA